MREDLFSLKTTITAIGFIAVFTSLTAYVAPPNNWDSMTYHMTRVMHWIQNHDVSHYPTSYPPQLYHPPFAEFVILHLQLLSGGDRFANFVQWFSMSGSVVGVSLIAKQLGATAKGQALSALFCITIPMGILQSSSTQNDYAVTFWMVCLACFIIQAVQTRQTLFNSLGTGASFGLAIFTKTTAYMFALPLLTWYLYAGLKRRRAAFLTSILSLAVFASAINVGHYSRNLRVAGSILGAPPEFTAEYKASIFGLRILISNLVKNLSLHFGTPIPFINDWITAGTERFHGLLGVPIRGSGGTSDFFWISSLITHEDMAGNFVHLMLIVIALLLFAFNQKRFRSLTLRPYLGSVLSAFVLFCILVKFQQFNSRHHLFFFVALSPFVGTVLSHFLTGLRVRWFVIGLTLCSLPWIFFNELRPLVVNSQIIKTDRIENIFYMPRAQQYFLNRSDLNTSENPYVKAADAIAKAQCTSLGLILKSSGTASQNNWEYPFWVLLNENKSHVTEIHHLSVDNYSKKLATSQDYRDFSPDCILAVEKDVSVLRQHSEFTYHQRIFKKLWSQDSVSVFQQ